MNQQIKTPLEELAQLRQLLVDHFNEGELRTLCFDLGVDYDGLPAEGKANKARELVAHLERRNQIPALLEIGRRLRPDVDWSQTYLDDRMADYRARRDQADQLRRERRERQRVVNLRPLDVTHTFKDRVREMQELCTHLAQGNVRLVSIVGRGGMGKTALASRVLADLEDTWLLEKNQVSGILYLSARSTGLSLERIYTDVGRMLGEPAASRLTARWASGEIPLVAKVEYLLETMQDGLYLILLDNLEDHLSPDGTIADEGLRLFVECCLTQPGGARLIATSREQVQVASAALRNARHIPLREGLPEDEAIALLRELDPSGELGLRDATESDLRRAVQLTGGIPRALEIIAGILQADPTANLPRLLADASLFGEQVVESLVAASYHRLGENERRVMEALAVFDCPIEETAIAYLLYPWCPNLDVRGCLRRLANSYFVSANRTTGAYSLHPIDREYAYQHLSDDEEPDKYNRRNLELRAADFYASIRKPESEWKTIEDLAPQLAEFRHHVRAGDYDNACQLLNPLDFDYLFMWGHCNLLAELREKLRGCLVKMDLQAANLGSLGLAYHALGEVRRALDLYQQAVFIAREIGERQGEGVWLGNLGSAYRDLGQPEQAIGIYTQALDIARETGDRRREGVWLGDLGSACHDLGHFEQATELYEQALAIYREIGDRRREGSELGNLGNTCRALGLINQAITFYETALLISREVGDRWAEGVHLGRLGVACRHLGQFRQALEFHEEALFIARSIGHRRVEGRQLGYLGTAYSALGQVGQTIELCKEALSIAQQTGDRRFEGVWLHRLGIAYCNLGKFEKAIELHRQALAITHEVRDSRGKSHRLYGLGKVLLVAGNLFDAARYLREALASNVMETNYHAALALGIILLCQHDTAAGQAFADLIAHCQTLLTKANCWYEAQYTLATALVGQAVCDLRWADASQCAELLAPALAEYRRALEITSAAGVVGDAISDLELIRKAGIEGLEPVFELLESARGQNA